MTLNERAKRILLEIAMHGEGWSKDVGKKMVAGVLISEEMINDTVLYMIEAHLKEVAAEVKRDQAHIEKILIPHYEAMLIESRDAGIEESALRIEEAANDFDPRGDGRRYYRTCAEIVRDLKGKQEEG